jgi:hypothetical protein
MELDLDLRGRGTALRAVLADAHGHVGVVLSGTELLVGSLVPGLLRSALPPNGRLAVSCGAARFSVTGGLAQTETLLLEGSLGRIGGGGTASLRDESLAITLLADLRVPVLGLGGGIRVRSPLPLTGRFAAPRLEWSGVLGGLPGGAAAGVAGLAGALANVPMAAAGAPTLPTGMGITDCAAALGVARGGRAGSVPAAPGAAEAVTRELPVQPPGAARGAGVLDQLMRGLRGR